LLAEKNENHLGNNPDDPGSGGGSSAVPCAKKTARNLRRPRQSDERKKHIVLLKQQGKQAKPRRLGMVVFFQGPHLHLSLNMPVRFRAPVAHCSGPNVRDSGYDSGRLRTTAYRSRPRLSGTPSSVHRHRLHLDCEELHSIGIPKDGDNLMLSTPAAAYLMLQERQTEASIVVQQSPIHHTSRTSGTISTHPFNQEDQLLFVFALTSYRNQHNGSCP
jgi:hypothetical protein